MAYVSMKLVLLVGAKLQNIIATLALESAAITGYFDGAKLKPRDDLFWFKKPALLLSLIHFVLFQVGLVYCDAAQKLSLFLSFVVVHFLMWELIFYFPCLTFGCRMHLSSLHFFGSGYLLFPDYFDSDFRSGLLIFFTQILLLNPFKIASDIISFNMDDFLKQVCQRERES